MCICSFWLARLAIVIMCAQAPLTLVCDHEGIKIDLILFYIFVLV